MKTLSSEEISTVGAILFDQKADLSGRFRALFTLRNVGGQEAIDWISKTLVTDPSPLLKHECAYCLGQMEDPTADSILKTVLENKEEHPMVRHEAGEALAAIGSHSSIDILKKYSTDDVIEVAQTCQLGVKRIEWLISNGDKIAGDCSVFNSVDPSPPSDEKDAVKLGETLRDNSVDLFDRYKAMFALRNLASEEAVKQLGLSLIKYHKDPSNNLLKHEIAYVFGQLQHQESIPFLREILADEEENEMVRHEAAEALGSVATTEASDLLQKFKDDKVDVVRESIQVALDMNEYENSQEQFNFFSTLELKHNK